MDTILPSPFDGFGSKVKMNAILSIIALDTYSPYKSISSTGRKASPLLHSHRDVPVSVSPSFELVHGCSNHLIKYAAAR